MSQEFTLKNIEKTRNFLIEEISQNELISKNQKKVYIKKKKHDKILSLSKSKLNSLELSISKALIDSSISYDQFVLINNVLKNWMM